MSKLNASCSSVICFSCPTCSGENCSLPSSLQLTLTDLKTYLSHHLETTWSSILSSLSLLGYLQLLHIFHEVQCLQLDTIIQERLSYYHMKKKDHVMHLADYIPIHTFHNNLYLFFFSSTLLPCSAGDWL